MTRPDDKQRALDDFPTNSGMTQWIISWFETHKETLRECLSQPEGVTDGWRSVETAPKDGTKFMAATSFGTRQVWFDAEINDFTFGQLTYDSNGSLCYVGVQEVESLFKLWMPFPAAPVLAKLDAAIKEKV